jgi:hypothetical protein
MKNKSRGRVEGRSGRVIEEQVKKGEKEKRKEEE